jgi:antibiotic biosynthesis monooxygenase (ABM) superfamily enzyme
MAANPTASPTVVIARRILPGHEGAFIEWDRRIRVAAEAFPGHLGSEVQPPDTSHPGEWVTLYSFATRDDLEAWLESDVRATLIGDVAPLLDGPVREQRVAASRQATEPVTVVFSQRVAPPNHEAFVALHTDVVERLQGFAGFLASDLFPPVPGIQDDHVIVASFASRPDLDRWLESDNRRSWVQQIEGLVEGTRTMNVVGGFGGWFTAQPSRPHGPKRWKQAVAVLLALFPTALAITLIRIQVAPDMNVVLAVFIGNVLGVAALSFVLMPWLTRILENWLNR